MINLDDVKNAAKTIQSFVHKTPLIHSNSFSAMSGSEVYLKAENLQKTGSFKVRGAFNKMIHIGAEKVIAASMGNHAQAVAYAASTLGKKSRIVMPVSASIVKEEATRGYGAHVILQGDTFPDSLNYALSQKEYLFIHAFDDDEIIAGQGTIGLEIMEELRNVDFVLVPVGGGGLIAGIATAVRTLSPKTGVIGVQTESTSSACRSFKEKKICSGPPLPTLADGIAVGEVSDRTFEIINSCVDDMVMVSEDSVAMAIHLFLERKKLVVEGAGAVPLAALMENKERFANKRVVLVISGGNIDFTLIDRIINKGLLMGGRIGTFEVIVEDVPGSLHSLTGVIASKRANILTVVHDRLSGDLPIGKTRVAFTVEIRGRDHMQEMLSAVMKQGFKVRM